MLPDTLITRVITVDEDVSIVTSTRNPGESDTDFKARHGLKVLEWIEALEHAGHILQCEALGVETIREEAEDDRHFVGRHVEEIGESA